MTLSELRAAVKMNYPRSDKDDFINSALNSGLVRVSQGFTWPELVSDVDVSVSAGDYSVSLPTGTKEVLEIWWIDGTQSYEVPIRTKKHVRSLYPDISSANAYTPDVAYVEKPFVFWAPPLNADGTLRLSVRKVPTAFSNDNDENPLDGLDDTLVCFATAQLFFSLQRFQEGSFWDGRFERALNDAKKDVRNNPGLKLVHAGNGQVEETPSDYWLRPFVRRLPRE